MALNLDPLLIAKGTSVLRVFHSSWKNYPAAKNMPFETFLALVKSRKPMGGEAFLEGLGLTSQQVSGVSVESIMRELAKQSQGKLPSKNYDFIQAITKRGSQFSYVDAAIYTATESAKDILSGAQAVGDSLITTGKILNFFLPVIIIGGLLWYANKKTGGALARGAKAIRS